jgi:hypothetical protein
VSVRAARKATLEANRILQHQTQANIISNSRQAWINELRECLSEYLSFLFQLSVLMKNERSARAETATNTFFDNSQKISHLRTKITLHLNPEEELHQELQRELTKITNDEFLKNGPDFGGAVAIGQKIFKGEWDRIKAESICPPPPTDDNIVTIIRNIFIDIKNVWNNFWIKINA